MNNNNYWTSKGHNRYVATQNTNLGGNNYMKGSGLTAEQYNNLIGNTPNPNTSLANQYAGAYAYGTEPSVFGNIETPQYIPNTQVVNTNSLGEVYNTPTTNNVVPLNLNNTLGDYSAYIQPSNQQLASDGTVMNSKLTNSVFDKKYAQGYDAGKANNINTTAGNALGWTQAGLSGLGLLGNLYYAEQNRKAQEDARNYARSRDALADKKTAKFQRNLV